MIIRLQKYGDFSKQLLLDTVTMNFKFHSHISPDSGILANSLCGFFDLVNSMVIALYKEDGRLKLMTGDKVFEADAIFVSYKRNNDYGELTISGKDANIVFNYPVNDKYFISTLTYTEEEEDVNFGLWLANILNSDERKRIILDNWQRFC